MRAGMWLSNFQKGTLADRPTVYLGAAEIAFYYATDEEVLYLAVQPDEGTTATWTAMLTAADQPVSPPVTIADLPTEDPGTSGVIWNNDGEVAISEGA